MPRIINCRNTDCPENKPVADGAYRTCGLDVDSRNEDGTCEHWLAARESLELAAVSRHCFTLDEIDSIRLDPNYSDQMEHNRECNE